MTTIYKREIMKAKKVLCVDCHSDLSKDEIALNKKLKSPDTEEFQCLECMSVSFGCDVDDLQTKIEEFKEQGCTLFI